MDVEHGLRPVGDDWLSAAPLADHRPVKQPLIEQGQRAAGRATVSIGETGQRLDLGPVAGDGHLALVEARLVFGHIVLDVGIKDLWRGVNMGRLAVSVAIDDDADVDQVIEVGRVTVGHDLRTVGGDDRRPLRRRGRRDRRVQRLVFRQGRGSAEVFGVGLILSLLQPGADAGPIGGPLGHQLAQLLGAPQLSLPVGGRGQRHLFEVGG